MIRHASHEDAEAIAGIYNHYIENTVITFEEDPITAAEMVSRMGDLAVGLPWFVNESEEDGKITGYTYASEWSGRCAYRYSVEVSIYLKHTSIGQGIGSALYKTLLSDLKARGLHSVIGGAAIPNAASVALHEKHGFEKVAHYKEVGRKFGRWIDVGYWQLILQADSDAPS